MHGLGMECAFRMLTDLADAMSSGHGRESLVGIQWACQDHGMLSPACVVAKWMDVLSDIAQHSHSVYNDGCLGQGTGMRAAL
eukprot:1889659-Ditylum_brightwellii.AAC.1